MLEDGFIAFAIVVAIMLVLGGLISQFGRNWKQL